jgi:hypothetical protein
MESIGTSEVVEESSGGGVANTGGIDLDALNGSTNMLVSELHAQLDYLKRSLSLRGIDLEAVTRCILYLPFLLLSGSVQRPSKSCNWKGLKSGSSKIAWKS